MSASPHHSAVHKKELSEVFAPLRHKGSLPNLRQKSSDPLRQDHDQNLSRKLEQLKTDSSKQYVQPSNDLQALKKRAGPRRNTQVQVNIDKHKTRDKFAYIFEKPVALLRSSVQTYMDNHRGLPKPGEDPGSGGDRPQKLLNIWGEQQLSNKGTSYDLLMR